MHRRYYLIFGFVFVMALIYAFWTQAALGRKLKTVRRNRNNLVSSGIKINVQFGDCEVKSKSDILRSSSEGIPSHIEMLDSLSGRSSDSDEIEIYVSVIVYKHSMGGREIQFVSEPINMARESLLIRLGSEKSSWIYCDHNDYSNYFFDLSFLFKE